MLQQLIEETGDLYDGFAFLVGELWRSSGQRNHSPTFIVGGLFFCSDGSPTCFGQECCQFGDPDMDRLGRVLNLAVFAPGSTRNAEAPGVLLIGPVDGKKG